MGIYNYHLNICHLYTACCNLTGDICSLKEEEYNRFVIRINELLDGLQLSIPAGVYIFFVVVGVTFNIVNIVVFTRPYFITPLNLILACYEAANIMVYATFIPDIIAILADNLSISYQWAVTDRVNTSLFYAAMWVSNWLMVAASAWRYVGIKWPIKWKIIASNTRAKVVVFGISCFSIIIFVTQMCLTDVVKYPLSVNGREGVRNTTIYNNELKGTWLSKHTFIAGNDAYLILVVTLLPWVITLTLTHIMLKELWKSRLCSSCLAFENEPKSSTVITITRPGFAVRRTSKYEQMFTIKVVWIIILMATANVPDGLLNIVLFFDPASSISETCFIKFARSRIAVLIYNFTSIFSNFFLCQSYRDAAVKHFSYLINKSGAVARSCETASL